jgi:hypothetical protein
MDKKLIVLLLASSFIFYGCTENQAKLCPNGVKNCYENDNYGFLVTYPEGWQVEEGGSATVTFISPQEAGQSGAPNCFIKVGQLPDNQSFSDYIDTQKAVFKEHPQLTLISEANRTINGLQAYEFISIYVPETENHTLQQEVIVKDRMDYIITCGAPQTLFTTYKPEFENIITSFRFG